MHRKSRRREDLFVVASVSPQFVRAEHAALPVVPIYFPGTAERVSNWFRKTPRRQNIRLLLLVLVFGLAGGITGGITGAVQLLQSTRQSQLGIQPEEATLSIAPEEGPIEIIRVPAAQARTRRRSFKRLPFQPRLIDEYQFIDFKQGKKGNHAAENDEGG